MTANILLIEDEELVGTMVRMNLESADYQVTWIKKGGEALDKATSETFDLILLDIALPEKSGLEILKELRIRGVNIPVMMLTARSDIPSKIGALQMGADDYLAKPFDVRELVARTEALLRRSQHDGVKPVDKPDID